MFWNDPSICILLSIREDMSDGVSLVMKLGSRISEDYAGSSRILYRELGFSVLSSNTSCYLHLMIFQMVELYKPTYCSRQVVSVQGFNIFDFKSIQI